MEESLGFGAISLRLLAVAVLVAANGFFVAAEFALVGARRSKIDHMVAEGDARARTVQRALAHLERYISGTQLGITLASLALGWLGEPAVAVRGRAPAADALVPAERFGHAVGLARNAV